MLIVSCGGGGGSSGGVSDNNNSSNPPSQDTSPPPELLMKLNPMVIMNTRQWGLVQCAPPHMQEVLSKGIVIGITIQD